MRMTSDNQVLKQKPQLLRKETGRQMKKTRIILMTKILFLEIMYTKYLLQVYAFLKIRGHFISLRPQTAQPR